MPEAACGSGPVRSFGSVAEYALIAEQKPGETPSQLIGMIESPGPVSVHSTVSPLAMTVTAGENDPSAFTFTVCVAASTSDATRHAAIVMTKMRFIKLGAGIIAESWRRVRARQPLHGRGVRHSAIDGRRHEALRRTTEARARHRLALPRPVAGVRGTLVSALNRPSTTAA